MAKIFPFLFKYILKGWTNKIILIVAVLIPIAISALVTSTKIDDFANNPVETFKSTFNFISPTIIIVVCSYVTYLATNMFSSMNSNGLSIILVSKPISDWKVIIGKYLTVYATMIMVALFTIGGSYGIALAISGADKFPFGKLFISQMIGILIIGSLIIGLVILLSSKYKQIITILSIIGGMVTLLLFGTITKAISGYNGDQINSYKQSVIIGDDDQYTYAKYDDTVNSSDDPIKSYSYNKVQMLDVFSQWNILSSMTLDEGYAEVLPNYKIIDKNTIKPIKINVTAYQERAGKIVETSVEKYGVFTHEYNKFMYPFSMDVVSDIMNELNTKYHLEDLIQKRIDIQKIINTHNKEFLNAATPSVMNPVIIKTLVIDADKIVNQAGAWSADNVWKEETTSYRDIGMMLGSITGSSWNTYFNKIASEINKVYATDKYKFKDDTKIRMIREAVEYQFMKMYSKLYTPNNPATDKTADFVFDEFGTQANLSSNFIKELDLSSNEVSRLTSFKNNENSKKYFIMFWTLVSLLLAGTGFYLTVTQDKK